MGAWPQLRETRTVGSERAPGTVIRCGVVDTMLADLAVSVVYFFEKAPHQEVLALGLARALEHVPVFAGRLRTVEDRLEIVCDGSGVPVSSYDVDETLAEAMARVTLPGADLVDHIDATRARTGDLPLLTVRISRLADGGMALGCCWHHAVGDIQSFMLLMRTWSAVVDGRPLPEVLLVEDQDANLDRVLPAEDSGRPGFRLVDAEEAAFLAREVEVSGRANRTVQVYFGDEEIRRMKEDFIGEAGRKLSTGDVLGAHVVSCVRRLDGDEETRWLTLPVNVRRPLDLPPGTIGNLLSEIHLPVPGGSAPYRLAVDIREAIEDFTGTHLNLRANTDFLRGIGRARLAECVPLGFDPAQRRFTVSSWSRFGAYEISFQGRQPVFFSPAANLQLPWVSWLVEGVANTGALWTAVLPARLAAKLRGREGRALLHRFRAPEDVLPALASAQRKLL